MTVKVSGLNKLRDKLKKTIKGAATDKGMMNSVARFAQKETKADIRAGLSPVTEQPFKILEPSTIRSRLYHKGGKSPYFNAYFSNLTLTGELVRNLVVKQGENPNELVIKYKGNHKLKKGTISNQELAKIHADMGRDTFGIMKAHKKKIVQAVKIFLSRRLG